LLTALAFANTVSVTALMISSIAELTPFGEQIVKIYRRIEGLCAYISTEFHVNPHLAVGDVSTWQGPIPHWREKNRARSHLDAGRQSR
jgi:hypothetical protein